MTLNGNIYAITHWLWPENNIIQYYILTEQTLTHKQHNMGLSHSNTCPHSGQLLLFWLCPHIYNFCSELMGKLSVILGLDLPHALDVSPVVLPNEISSLSIPSYLKPFLKILYYWTNIQMHITYDSDCRWEIKLHGIFSMTMIHTLIDGKHSIVLFTSHPPSINTSIEVKTLKVIDSISEIGRKKSKVEERKCIWPLIIHRFTWEYQSGQE